MPVSEAHPACEQCFDKHALSEVEGHAWDAFKRAGPATVGLGRRGDAAGRATVDDPPVREENAPTVIERGLKSVGRWIGNVGRRDRSRDDPPPSGAPPAE
jgi:hypothetical protein